MIISAAISVSNHCAMAEAVVSRQQLAVSFVPFFPLSLSSPFYILEYLSLQNSPRNGFLVCVGGGVGGVQGGFLEVSSEIHALVLLAAVCSWLMALFLFVSMQRHASMLLSLSKQRC